MRSLISAFQAEVTQRLSNAKEAASKPAGLQNHEDLARKLQVVSLPLIMYLDRKQK